ncbi:transketolase [Nostocales cyanobacterium HT-58-2]|nr:transketolase [Nostocales cyanobacterium HT-58-2]
MQAYVDNKQFSIQNFSKKQRIEDLSINTIRTLTLDAIQQANSGHAGAALALTPLGYCLWQRFLRFDPNDAIWPNRDRFVLSVGHACMLLYSLLHLCEVKAVNSKYEQLGELAVPLDEIKRFRQLNSKCTGHPEYRVTTGVETTTGALGQGLATSVGMAIAGKWMAAHFNRPGFEMFNYNVYSVGGDGCMMEGVSSEAASLAGHLKLSNLCWIYDNNKITIEGSTDLSFTEDVATRFIAYGWNVTRVGDANDLEMLDRALTVFEKTHDRPTLIIIDSHIGYGSPHFQDTSRAHGGALGEEEVQLMKRNYGWPEDAKFFIPEEVREHFRAGICKRGHDLREEWMQKFREYQIQYPDLADELYQMQHRELPENWDKDIPTYAPDDQGIPGPVASGEVLNAIAKNVPWLVGGSADLAPATKTTLTFEGTGDFSAQNYGGRNFHYGIREHAMGAIVNGLSLSKIRACGSGMLVFSDYMRPPIRFAALMQIPVIHVFSHDTISGGQDGPTHQPVEHLASLRNIPGLITLRPADANEVAEAWRVIVNLRYQPACLILGQYQQTLPILDRSKFAPASGLTRGAYVLIDAEDSKPDVILLAGGSEVSLCVQAYELLKAEGIKTRVVSMPSWELFEQQSKEYRESVIPPEISARVSVEEGGCLGWERYVGPKGYIMGIPTFGDSAPLKELQKKFGFTPENIAAIAKMQVGKK